MSTQRAASGTKPLCNGPRPSLSLLSGENAVDRSSSADLKISRRGLPWTALLALVVVLLVLGLGYLPAQAQTLAPVWTQLAPANSPSSREFFALTYDQAHGQIVLFGGTSPNGRLNDTWVEYGGNWTQGNPLYSPPGREYHAMAFDPAHSQVVMFGGLDANNNNLGDTWLWDGTQWNEGYPANSPPARREAVMVDDPATGQVLLFGGWTANGPANDLWVWDGTNWTQQSPANKPSARVNASMAYDAATGQVILFGGYDGNNFLHDTWAWTGTNWVQQSPTNSPPAPFAQAMDYDAAQGKLVMVSGYNSSHDVTDTWLYDGITWTQTITPVSPAGRNEPNGMVYDTAQNQMVLFGGAGLQSQALNDTWAWAPSGNLGAANVCPSGQSTPAPCSSTLSLTFNLPSAVSLSSPQVVTQGAPGLDFQLANNGNTCLGTLPAGSCTVNVTFSPLAPGLRTGALQLKDAAGNLLTTTPLYGTGEAPVIAIGPGTQKILNTSGYTLIGPNHAVVDAANNVYISDMVAGQVLEVTPNGLVTPVGVGLASPQGLAIDGAGDVFIADNTLNQVIKVPAGCKTSSCQQVLGGNLQKQFGVAVDGAGDVFISAFNAGQVVELPAGCTSAACQTVVYNQSYSFPLGLAVDAAGDLFIAAWDLQQIVEIPAGCTSSSCQQTVGQGWIEPEDVAVDAAGDLFVADVGLGAVIKVPAGCTSSSCQSTVASGVSGFGVAVDAQGDIIIPDSNSKQVFEVNRSQAPSFTFAATSVGSTSSDSPRSAVIQNVGNQALVASTSEPIGGGLNFRQVAGSGSPADCSGSFTLAPGAACNLSLSFTPQVPAVQIGGEVIFSDNTLNGAANQAIPLAGAAIPANFGITLTEIGSGTGTVTDNLGLMNCVAANGTFNGTCSASYPASSGATLTATASGTSTFLGWGGVCASAGTNFTCTVASSQAGNATASFVNQSFGNVNVCAAAQSAAGNCTSTLPVTFNLANTTMIGAIQVVTQGVSGLDFALGTSTCSGTVTAGNACNVNVTFTPLAAGLRLGAIELFDSTGNLVTSTPVYGIGQEPEIAFGPGTQTVVNTTANLPLSQPNGITVDAAGDVFISDYGFHRVVKVAANGTASLVGSGLSYPQGLAVDGAGDLFIADNNRHQVVKVPGGCTSASCQTTVGVGLFVQFGVAVDGAGDVFAIASSAGNQVVEVPAGCTSSACQNVVYSAGAGSNPNGIAVDAAGDLFVADIGLAQVIEVPAGCKSTSCQTKVGQGWAQPNAVAVDAAGDVFVSDQSKNSVVEVPAGCTSSSCQTAVLSGAVSVAVAVDPLGNIFVPEFNNHQVIKLNRSQAPSFNFALTNAGATSSDSPQSVLVQNVGNQPLTGSLALNLGGNFTESVAPDCSASFPMAPGAVCTESFSFTPQSATFFSGTAAFSDNALNTSSTGPQTITFTGTGASGGQAGTVAVPNVVGQTQTAVASPIGAVGLVMGTVTTEPSTTVASGSVISQNPASGTQVNVGSAVSLLVSSGQAPPPSLGPLSLENNYFLTGDYVSAGVTLRGTGAGGTATGTITIPTYAQSGTQGVPDGADIIDAFLYWETVENTPMASSTSGLFNHYPITGQQIGNDLPNYKDGQFTGTIRAYRANVNLYLPVGANGIRFASGAYTVALPDSGGTALPLTEGASLVLVYRVLSPNFPLKSVVIYDGAALPASAGTQVVQGFYDAVGGGSGSGKNTNLFAANGNWNNSVNSVTLGQSNQYSAPLNPANAYAAVILSTPVNNSDNDGILDAWKVGPPSSDFHAGQPGYYDVKTGTWVGLPGAKHGQKDLFVQLDYMCGALLSNGSCDPSQENLFPSPDSNGNDPLAMVQQAFAASGVQLHLNIGNAVPESTCTDDLTTSPATLCQFPNQPGVIGWKNSLEFSKLYPRNLAACLSGGDCTTRFPYGQKDSYHYVLMGHSLAIPAWNTRYATLTSINVANGITTIGTVDRGTGINACPSRITISGVLGNPSLNGVFNTTGCSDTKTITVATPGVSNWSYPNSTLPEPVIGLTSGTISSISGYSDLGGADSAVTLGLWLTAPNQDMSKRANVLAGTIFHEIGHTLGLSHGGLYYDTPGSYVPTFDANCKPNYQSVMNYLFQLDLMGPSHSLAFSNQALLPLSELSAGSMTQLTDASGNAATFPTSAWYVPYTTGSPVSPATLHCDGTPLNGEQGYRVDASVAPISPAWTNGEDLSFIGSLQSNERGFNDLTNLDLRQVGATGGEFASLASLLSFGSSVAPLNISAGGTAALGSGGTVALGSGGTVTLGSGGNVTLGSGGTVTMGSGGTVTLGSGGTVTLGSGGTVTPGNGGTVTLGSGGTVTLGSGGTVALGSGGTVTLGSGGTVTLGSGGTIALGSGGAVTIPSTGGSYSIDGNGGTVTLGSGGTVALGSGGTVTLGSGGTIALGSGGTVALGSGGTATLGSGGTVALGSGGTVALGSGGNVTLGGGGTVALGSGGTVTLGSGGTVSLGSGGTVTLGSGGTSALGSGGTVTLGSGGTATLGSGGTVTLGSGGTVTLGSGGTVSLGSGGTVTLGSGGTVTLGSGGAPLTIGAGGTVTLGSGGTVTLGSGGTIALGSGGTVALGSGGTVTLGSGGVVTLGNGGSVSMGSGSDVSLGSVSSSISTPASGGPLSNELTYETANSVVRPPSSPTETSMAAGVRVNWQAPAFGVVQTYTIYRSSNGATPIVIGSVSGVNGHAPATEFTDTNPDLTSKTVIYTVTTTIVPDATGSARQSAPSPPAVLKNDQSITLGPLPSSVTLTSVPTVTATAMSGGVPNGLQVVFSATGSCSIGSQSMANNTTSASVTLNTTGSCTVLASQLGTSAFNAANAVSGTFMVLPQGSGTKSQTISFAALPNMQYGGSFSLSATSSAGLPVSFTAAGPCTTGGSLSAVGVCKITATAPANSSYSAGSLTQSFNIYPAVLKVTPNNLAVTYGQSLPALTYAYSGFVNGDTATAISGVPALATTATSASLGGTYPITVSTGTLASTNYSFLYVNGTLTVQSANQSPLVLTAGPTLVFNQVETLSVTGGSSSGVVTYNLLGSGPCTVSGSRLTAASGTGTCQVSATMAGNADYSAVTTSPVTVTLARAPQTIAFTTNAPANAAYPGTFTVAATSTSGGAVAFTSSGACTNVGATYTLTAGTGSCVVLANQAGNANFAAAPSLTQTVTATGPLLSVSPSSISFGTVPLGSLMTRVVTVTNNGSTAVSIHDPLISIVKGGNSSEFVAVNLCPSSLAAGKACTMTVTFVAGPFYTPQTATLQVVNSAPGSPQTVTLTATVLMPQTITFTTNPPASAAYKSNFTVAVTGGASGNAVTFTSAGACTNVGATYTMTGSTGTCSIIANQAGNATYSAAAQVTRTATATSAPQTITFTTNPPLSASYKSSFTVAAAGGASGNAVTFKSSGSCSNVGTTYTMTANTGTCSVLANQAGNGTYTAAAQVTKTVTASK